MKSLTENLNLNLLELLSVLLPGAICLAILNKIEVVQKATIAIIPLGDNWGTHICYFSAAYFIGYAIFIISSYVDELFDGLKNKYTHDDENQINIKKVKKVRWLKWVFPYIDDTNELTNQIIPIKEKHLGYSKHKPITAYQYCYRRLMIEGYPHMIAEVERYEASSKFFRSMIVVWFLGFFVFFSIAFTLLIISLLVYLNRRQKALNVAIKNILVIEGVKRKVQKQIDSNFEVK
jgi:hypothetical protein